MVSWAASVSLVGEVTVVVVMILIFLGVIGWFRSAGVCLRESGRWKRFPPSVSRNILFYIVGFLLAIGSERHSRHGILVVPIPLDGGELRFLVTSRKQTVR